MYVKPRTGLSLLNPETYRPLPPEGEQVSDEFKSFWLRRQTDGDVEISEGPAPEEATRKAK